MIHNIQLRFHPKELSFPCDKNGNVSKTYFPIYYKVIKYAYNGVLYKGVQYEVKYQYNYAIGLFDLAPTNPALGYHENDVERIMVLYDIESDEPMFVFLSAHSQEGRWFKFNELKIEDGRIVVYVALYSHRHFNKATTLWRMFGFANDRTSDDGKHINMESVVDPTIDERVWNKEVLDTPFRSFFLPLYVGILPKLKKEQLDYENKLNEKL